MRTKIFLFLIIFILIISLGCGGENTITQPASVSNTTNNNTTDTPSNSKLILTIKWPEPGAEGDCLISSSDNRSSLTASMPYGSKKVKVEIYEYNEPSHLLGFGEVSVPDTTIEIEVPIESTQSPPPEPINTLPSVKVLIKVIALNGAGQILSDVLVPEFQIMLGINPIMINLGGVWWDIYTSAIVLEDYPLSLSDKIRPDNLTLNRSETYITSWLITKYPNPTPVPTPDIILPEPIPTIFVPRESYFETQGVTPLTGLEIKYTILGGYGELSNESGSGQSITGIINSEGYNTVKLRSDVGVDMQLKAQIQLDPTDPNTIIYRYFTIPVKGKHKLSLTANPPTIYYQDPNEPFDPNLPITSTMTNTLVVEYPPEVGLPSKPLEGKRIFYEIISPNLAASFLSPEPLYRDTDANGQCNINFTLKDNTEVWIRINFPIYGIPYTEPYYGWKMVWYPANDNRINSAEISDIYHYGCEEDNNVPVININSQNNF